MHRIRVVFALVVAFVGMLGSGPAWLETLAQEGTPAAGAAEHPLVGTWIVDPEVNDPANPPSFDVYMADGTAINVGSEGASAGAWEATGPRTAMLTIAGLIQDAGSGAGFILRANVEVDEAGESFTATHSFTLVAADGTVLAAVQGGTAHGTRLLAEPLEAIGEVPAGFPTWASVTPVAGTPTS